MTVLGDDLANGVGLFYVQRVYGHRRFPQALSITPR